MKILHLATREVGGGASRAMLRLHRALRKAGLDSSVMVGSKSSRSAAVHGSTGTLVQRLRAKADTLPIRFYRRQRDRPFSVGLLPSRVHRRISALKPDLLHTHWVNDGFTDLGFLTDPARPIVITMHDMWWMTGGCHYTGGCASYLGTCGSCPVLASGAKHDLSWLLWSLKSRIYSRSDLTFIAPSNWIGNRARDSALVGRFPIHVIPNAIDTDLFRPLDQAFSRNALGLPKDLPLVLFSALNSTSDPRKGFAELRRASAVLESSEREFGVVVLGSQQDDLKLNVPTFNLGHLADDYSLVLAYSAADVFACPSLEDNLPNTVVESLACGLPTVAFNAGGLPDLVTHRKNGYLAKFRDAEDFAYGLRWCLEPGYAAALRRSARATALAEYSEERVARQHVQLYESLLHDRKQVERMTSA